MCPNFGHICGLNLRPILPANVPTLFMGHVAVTVNPYVAKPHLKTKYLDFITNRMMILWILAKTLQQCVQKSGKSGSDFGQFSWLVRK